MHPKAFMSEEEANWPELVAKEENAGRPEVCSLAVVGTFRLYTFAFSFRRLPFRRL